MTDMDKLRYPIGPWQKPEFPSPDDIRGWIDDIAALPNLLENAVHHISEERLDTPYRPGGWTVRQVVHHLADSHLNCYIRCKWTLTEDTPTIKAYDENGWAALPDARELPIEYSLNLVQALHARWVCVLENLTEEDMGRGFNHPESGYMDFPTILSHYAWHGRQHLAHIQIVQPG
jgi:hypothetical protein